MSKRSLIEDCFFITPSYNNMDYSRMKKLGIHIEYHMEAADHILVTVGSNEPKRIETEDVPTSVAWRRYFLCPECNKRAHKLYLLPDGKEFKCRSCHHCLRYLLTTINKNTRHGKMVYAMNRMDRLSKRREKIGTVIYKGKYTKKFKNFLKQCEKVGYNNAPEDARNLMTALENFNGVR